MSLSHEITIPVPSGDLYGFLSVPPEASGIVVFAHGSGSGRHSPRNQDVASVLQEAGFATLLFDLLTEHEDVVDRQTREHRFNIPMLAERLIVAATWLGQQDETTRLPIGFFGASTGAGAALIAAARLPETLAVVSRGGRPDLAGEALEHVMAPTLLIVGERDKPVIGMNQRARQRLKGTAEMVIVPGATHLFEEPGALDQVTRHAVDWFRTHMSSSPQS